MHPSIRILLWLFAAMPSLAQAEAGRILMSVGDVAIVRGTESLSAGIGTAVESGDTLRLGPRSNAQVRFTDESIVSLREKTTFKIDEYRYTGASDGSERGFFSLLAGGMRTVTGLIGKLKRLDRYAVRTKTSTIGIRGTHYTLRECDGDCTGDDGALAPNGTYGGITDGTIGVVNDVADAEFGKDEFFYVANRTTAPEGLIGPPPFLHDKLEGQTRTKGEKGKETGETLAQGGVNAESRSNEPPAAPAPSTFVVTEQKTQTGTSTVVGATSDTAGIAGWITGQFDDLASGAVYMSQTQLGFGAGGFLSTFTIPAGCTGAVPDCNEGFSATLGTPVQNGQATFPGSTQTVFWGRWANGNLVDGGTPITLSTTAQAHIMYGPLTPADTIAAKSGTIMLQSTFPGGLGTTPTNNFGALATGGTLPNITVDFTSRTAATTAWSVNFPSTGTGTQNWSFPAGSSSLVVVSGAGAHFLVDVTGGSCASAGSACNGGTIFAAKGRTAGIFIGPVGDHAGVALSGAAGSSQFNTVRVYCPTC